MKTFESCHLIINRNYNDCRHIREFVDVDFFEGEISAVKTDLITTIKRPQK